MDSKNDHSEILILLFLKDLESHLKEVQVWKNHSIKFCNPLNEFLLYWNFDIEVILFFKGAELYDIWGLQGGESCHDLLDCDNI